VQITFRRLLSAAAIVTAALFLGVPPSHAATYGNEKWCAVTNDGGDAINWDCEYATVADCSPAVTQGNRGFCAINPYYQPLPASAPQR
jgi:uncharacterized protein DUF3551